MEISNIKDITDFNWKEYLLLNPYLYIIGLRNKEECEENYLKT